MDLVLGHDLRLVQDIIFHWPIYKRIVSSNASRLSLIDSRGKANLHSATKRTLRAATLRGCVR